MSLNPHTPAEVNSVLMEQLPDWFRPVLEYIAIMKAYSAALSDVESIMARIEANYFIQTADSATLAYWEKLLRIPARTGDTLEFRRDRILLKLTQRPPFTVSHFRDKLTELFGEDYTLSVDVENCGIAINVTSERYGAAELLFDLINELVPVHLYLTANQIVTNYVQSTQYLAALSSLTIEQTIGGA